MGRLHVEAEQDTWAAPGAIWTLISDATRYPEWGPWSAGGYQRQGDTSARGAGAVQWLRSSRRAYLRYPVSIEKILEAEEGRRLAYTVIGGIPVRNYRAEVTLTPVTNGTRIRWTAAWDATLAGRIVRRTLRKLYPQIVADLVTAAENQAAGKHLPDRALKET
jgi:Polyketide cyclase / dehydrase and lipid transport